MKRAIRFVFKQYEFMPIWVGGALVVTLELLGILNIPNFIGIWINVWETHPQWHGLFLGVFGVFLGVAVLLFVFLALVYFKLFVYARQRYQQEQAHRESRSPLYRQNQDADAFLRFLVKERGGNPDRILGNAKLSPQNKIEHS